MMIGNCAIAPLIIWNMLGDLSVYCRGEQDPHDNLPATVTAHSRSTGTGTGTGGFDSYSKLEALKAKGGQGQWQGAGNVDATTSANTAANAGSGAIGVTVATRGGGYRGASPSFSSAFSGADGPSIGATGTGTGNAAGQAGAGAGGYGGHGHKSSLASVRTDFSDRSLAIGATGRGSVADGAPLLSEHRALQASARLSASLLPAHAARMQALHVTIRPGDVFRRWLLELGKVVLGMTLYQIIFWLPGFAFQSILIKTFGWAADKVSLANTIFNVAFFMILVPTLKRIYGCYVSRREAAMRAKEEAEERLSEVIGDIDEAAEAIIPRSPSRADIDVDAPVA